jgi:predicted pyridoxine 5'-phosphate oxidase superfamily flavin-nucleotide-binding protein
MAAIVPDAFKDLFTKVAFAHLATVMADGSPQVTPVWCSYDGTLVWINTAKGRLKDKNMRRNKQVGLSI